MHFDLINSNEKFTKTFLIVIYIRGVSSCSGITVETLFGCLKNRGFNFESTHMAKPERISKLVALLAIAFCWCHIAGEWLNSQKPIKIKKHGRKAISIFRYGLDELRQILLNISEKMESFKKMIALLKHFLLSSSPLI